MGKKNTIRKLGEAAFPIVVPSPNKSTEITLNSEQEFIDWLFDTNRFVLSQRLGLDDSFEDELLNWAQIGVALAKDTPEFHKSNEFGHRGRPETQTSVNEQRLDLIDARKQERGGTDRQAIKDLVRLNKLPRHVSEESMAQSISRIRKSRLK